MNRAGHLDMISKKVAERGYVPCHHCDKPINGNYEPAEAPIVTIKFYYGLGKLESYLFFHHECFIEVAGKDYYIEE